VNIQFKKGVMELCVLALLAEQDCYGYELVTHLSRGVGLAEGTVYPLLKRLRDDGYIVSYLQESPDGPPRKYYRLLPVGRAYERELETEWNIFIAHVSEILRGRRGEPSAEGTREEPQ